MMIDAVTWEVCGENYTRKFEYFREEARSLVDEPKAGSSSLRPEKGFVNLRSRPG
jgi:hypothetical protein